MFLTVPYQGLLITHVSTNLDESEPAFITGYAPVAVTSNAKPAIPYGHECLKKPVISIAIRKPSARQSALETSMIM